MWLVFHIPREGVCWNIHLRMRWKFELCVKSKMEVVVAASEGWIKGVWFISDISCGWKGSLIQTGLEVVRRIQVLPEECWCYKPASAAHLSPIFPSSENIEFRCGTILFFHLIIKPNCVIDVLVVMRSLFSLWFNPAGTHPLLSPPSFCFITPLS